MRAIVLSFVFGLLLFSNVAYGQFSESDVSITVTGLSEVNTKKFRDSKKVFIESLNKLNVPTDIKPLKVEVIFKKNVGCVRLTVNFKNETIYAVGSEYFNHGKQFGAFGKGISFYFQHQLMQALGEYKFSVAKEGTSINEDIAEFGSIVCLKKTNGDIMYIYAYNKVDNSGYGSLYPYHFLSSIEMKIAGKVYNTECGNSESLENMKFFFVDELIDPSGMKTGAYYFCKFFNISTE